MPFPFYFGCPSEEENSRLSFLPLYWFINHSLFPPCTFTGLNNQTRRIRWCQDDSLFVAEEICIALDTRINATKMYTDMKNELGNKEDEYGLISHSKIYYSTVLRLYV